MIFTTNNIENAEKYDCFNSIVRCKSTWTYDNHHCTGCHWKGLGKADISNDDTGELENAAKAVELKLTTLED
jgi:hypothetical protein